jgi:endonuclease-3
MILKKLKCSLALPELVKITQDPFRTLIMTIISQNTNDDNTERAFDNLSKRFQITPQVLATAEKSQIEECLYTGGLYKNKTKTIQSASKVILEKYHGNISSILSLPLNDAREKLMEIDGVGPKTSDVVLLFSANKPTIPIDTHVARVSKRLVLTPEKSNYEEIRSNLQFLFEEKDYLSVHLLLIALGRKYCRSHRPLCIPCPVSTYCPSSKQGIQHG